PDATDVTLDPKRTSLSGLGATWVAGRLGDTKHWRFGTGGDLRTPGLELNDAGFQQGAARMIPYVWGEYRVDEPSKNLLNWSVNADVFTLSTFEPTLLASGLETFAGVQLANYWIVRARFNLTSGGWDPTALRGGSALRTDPNAFAQ